MLSKLRFCRKCLATQQAVTRQICGACGGELLPFLDENGAISRAFLIARETCCGNGCRNCPYEKVNATAHESVSRATEKTCPRCDELFECRSGACWCENVRLCPSALEQLDRNFIGCLCPACRLSFQADE